MVENGKAPQSDPNSESYNVVGQQRAHQSGGSNVGPNLVQNQSTQLDSSRTNLGTDSRIDLEPISSHTQERLESVSVDLIIPQPQKHQISHPVDQIMSNINTGVQTTSKPKNFCALYAFLSIIEPKNVHEALTGSDQVTVM